MIIARFGKEEKTLKSCKMKKRNLAVRKEPTVLRRRAF